LEERPFVVVLPAAALGEAAAIGVRIQSGARTRCACSASLHCMTWRAHKYIMH